MENSSDRHKLLSNPSYSKNSKSQTSSLLEVTDPKRRYMAVIQQEKENERVNLHKKLSKQKEEEEKLYRKHLKAEIKKRKKELEELEHYKESGMEEHKKATHQANIKKEKDKIKKMEDQVRAKTIDQKTKKRYKEALDRQKIIDQEANKKRTQAENLRKTHLRTEAVEREEAVKFNKSLNEKQVKAEYLKEKAEAGAITQYRAGLSMHGFSQRLLTTEKPVNFVVKQNEEENDAISRAQAQEIRNSEKEKLRAEVLRKNRKTAEDRGNMVLSKMQRQREYESYCKEAEEQQKRYNLRRIEAGRRNQYAGVKPLTLSQIDINKKIRLENEFERMFIDNPTHLKSEPANKYKIVETKMVDVIKQPTKQEKWVKKPINYGDNESLIPGISEGHYSFESEEEQKISLRMDETKKSSKKEVKNVKSIMKETKIANAKDEPGKTRLKQTRLSNEALRHELNYSDSEQDSNI